MAGVHLGPRAQLVIDGATPLRASDLVPHRNYVFHYPFQSTPCFLLDLGTPVSAGELAPFGYVSPGGGGRSRAIVAYSAICPHAYAHPTREHAMIHYFGPDRPATVARRDRVITCCVHGSAFDPARGAVPLQPPAQIPLAAVALEWEARTDSLYALGVVGRPVFEEFFKSFPANVRHPVAGVIDVWELERYSRMVIPC